MLAPTMKSHGRLATLGAFGVAAACVVVFALFVWMTLPTPSDGLDFEHRLISRVAVGAIVAAVAAVHVVYARQLLAYAKDQG